MDASPRRSPDQTQEGWDVAAGNYEEVAEPFTSLFGEEALRLLGIKPGDRVLDVAAGPGGLSIAAAGLGAEVVSIDFSEVMIRRLRTRLAQAKLANVTARTMDGQSMDFSDDEFDAAFSVFGLIFFPDYIRGLQEMRRVLKSGGRAAVVAWSAPERFGLLQAIMGALRTGVPTFAPPTDPPVWLRLHDPQVLAAEMENAGFKQVSVHTLTRAWTAPSADWLRHRLPGMSPGLSFLFDTLSTEESEAFGEALAAQFGDGPAIFEGEAHLGIGSK